MADLEKSKTPFEDFIKSLDKMNTLKPGITLLTTDANLAEELVKKYGLPEDPETIKIIVLTQKNWQFLTKMKFPPILWAYIKVLMWQVAVENDQPLQATLTAFLWGMAFGNAVDIET